MIYGIAKIFSLAVDEACLRKGFWCADLHSCRVNPFLFLFLFWQADPLWLWRKCFQNQHKNRKARIGLIPTDKKNIQFLSCYALVFLGVWTTALAALFHVKHKLCPNLLWKNELLKIKTVSTTVMSRPKGKRNGHLPRAGCDNQAIICRGCTLSCYKVTQLHWCWDLQPFTGRSTSTYSFS